MTPHTVTRQAAQGDLLVRRIDALPVGLVEVVPAPEGHILAHSETGHHHLVREPSAVRLLRPADDTGPLAGLVAYLEVLAEHADVVHARSWDTHDTLRLPRGVWEIRRQRERAPEGWRRVQD